MALQTQFFGTHCSFVSLNFTNSYHKEILQMRKLYNFRIRTWLVCCVLPVLNFSISKTQKFEFLKQSWKYNFDVSSSCGSKIDLMPSVLPWIILDNFLFEHLCIIIKVFPKTSNLQTHTWSCGNLIFLRFLHAPALAPGKRK